jgi:hypothetical protein
VRLTRNSTVVTGHVQYYEAETNSESSSFPVSYRWHGEVIWTISGADECTIVPDEDHRALTRSSG